jgi:hypothetical protein
MLPITRNDLVVFLIAFCLGLLVIGLMEDRPEVIIRWPTPKNAGLVTYVDRASNCYEYEAKETKCTDTAKTIPLSKGEGFHQHGDDPTHHTRTTTSLPLLLQPKENAPTPQWEDAFISQ